ncbi:Wzz/FepE/Etk N-terminal domain-containing protein [Marivita sp.]|uniref:Wzz/FepE/Etk N-terminal domain-containing protein n=1 Tax=Marivita sp. TaxID=2003365 RepID=UPI003F706FBE
MQDYARSERGQQSSKIEDDEIDLLQLFGTLWRGKWIIILCAMIAVLVGGYYAYGVAVPKYSATTTLALQIRGSQIVDIESVMSGVSSDDASLNTEIEVIKSRKLGEQLVTRLSLTEDPEFNPTIDDGSVNFLELALSQWFDVDLAAGEKVTRELLDRWLGISLPADEALSERQVFDKTVDNVMEVITATLQRNTFVFSVSAKSTDPQKSVRMANTLAEIYIADQIAVKFEATENAVTWLSERVTDLEVELKTREDEIKELRAGSSLVTPESLAALNQQANDMSDRLVDLRALAQGAEARLGALQQLQASGDVDAMQATFSDPVLRRLYNDLASGGQQTRDLFDDRFSLLIQREANDTQRAVAQAVSLETSYENLQEEIALKTQDLVEVQQAEREVQATRVLYETFLARLKETTVQRGLQEADARVLSPSINGQYVEPRKSRILALSLILGGMIGVAIVLLQQFLHNGFRTAEDLERHTGISVMGQIPRIPISKRESLVPYLKSKPTSAASEAIRNLRTSVLLSNIDSPPKVIMSTSSIPGEGKTTQAISLATNFAGLGKSVLLIECDIRRRTFTRYFKNVPDGGIVTALARERPLNEIVFHDPELDVDVLMGEKSAVNAADLFSSDRFHEFIRNARNSYDIVLIDTPPVLVVPDARVIGQSVDAILYSVAWDRTAKGQIDEGIRQLATAKLKITGFVLSQIDPKGMARYGYGGRYSAYGAYAKYGKHYYDT